MADSTRPLDQLIQAGEFISYPVAAVKIQKGSAVWLNSSGYATGTYSSGQAFLGIANETVDNSAGSAGDKNIVIQRRGVMTVTTTGAAITKIGQKVFWTDNQTVSFTESANYAGTVVAYVSSTSILIQIEPASVGARLGSLLNTNVTTNGTQYTIPMIVPVAGVDTVVYVTAKDTR